MRYAHQQKSEIESWKVDEIFTYYDEIHRLVEAENKPRGK